jgi:hypothetical protein
MEKFIEIIKNHKWAIVLALITVAIVAGPQIYFHYQNSDIYQGIEIIGNDSPWAARVQEIRDGHINLGSVYYKDGKNDPYLFQPLGSIVVAYLGKIFSLDLNNTLLLFRIIFTFLVSLLIYGFMTLLSKNKFVALMSPIAILSAESFLRGRSGISLLLSGESPRAFLWIVRAVNPLMTFFFFFGFLLCFWLFYEKKKIVWGVVSALMLGLTFYDYFYTWTFLYAFCGILVLIFIFQKKWQDIKRIIIMLFGGAILAIPYFLNLYHATIHPNYPQMKLVFGMIQSHALKIGLLAPLVLVVFLLLFSRKWRDQYLFVLALVLTPFVTLGQQVITGKMLQVGHYHWFFHAPIAIIVLLMIFFHWTSKVKLEFAKRVLAISMIVVGLYAGIFIQAVSYTNIRSEAIESQRYGSVFAWFNKNAAKEDVVFANDRFSYLTVIYTPLNVFYHNAAMYSLSATKSRLLDALFVYYRLDGVNENNAQEVFFKDKSDISGKIYGMYYRELSGSYAAIPDNKIQEIVDNYRESLTMSNNKFFNQAWNKYEVKYLVWDKKNDPQWNLDQYKFIKKVVEIGDFVIYQND